MGWQFSNQRTAEAWIPALTALGIGSTLTIWIETAPWIAILEVCTFLLGADMLLRFADTLSHFRRVSVAALTAIPVWGVAQICFHITDAVWQTIPAILAWTTLATVFLCGSALLNSRQRIESFITYSATFASALCTFSTLQFFTSNGKYFWIWPGDGSYVFGPFQSKNNYASFVLLTLPLVLWKGIEKREINWVWIAAASLMGASIVASGSRAGCALLAIELPAFAILARRKWHRLALVGGLTAGLAVMVTGSEALRSKLGDNDPLRYRREMIGAAIQMTLDRPLSGYGLGSYTTIYPKFATFDSGHYVNHAHNDWAEWTAEGGLPVLLLLVVFSASIVRPALSHCWAIGILAVMLHALVDYPFQRFGVSIWLFLLAAAAQGASINSGNARASPTLETRLPKSGYAPYGD